MTMLGQITPVILTYNEEPNIERVLRKLTWAPEIVICDSFSTDRTLEIAAKYPQVRVVQRKFDYMENQWRFAFSKVRTPWAMMLDADHILTDELIEEMSRLEPPANTHAYLVPFIYAVGGKNLRATLYPPREVLQQPQFCTLWQDGHTHRTTVHGDTGELRSGIIHDDRKSFARFIRQQRTYMRREAEKIRTAPWASLNVAGKIRRLRVVAPFAVLLYTFVVRRLFLDGWAGIVYTFQRTLAEFILSWELLKPRPR
jgi:glycosyltransferase involved in cell wall biosynthesis